MFKRTDVCLNLQFYYFFFTEHDCSYKITLHWNNKSRYFLCSPHFIRALACQLIIQRNYTDFNVTFVMSMQPSSSKVIVSSTEKEKTPLATDISINCSIIYLMIAVLILFFFSHVNDCKVVSLLFSYTYKNWMEYFLKTWIILCYWLISAW